MSYRLIEGCCGSAALTLHLCGIKKPIIPYQGSKWKCREYLEKVLISEGISGSPQEVELYDPGPWSKALKALVENQNQVILYIERLNEKDPQQVYQSLQGQAVPQDLFQLAAEFLFLQRLSFSGKAVGYSSGFWSSPGFNKTSAYGLSATDKFGAVNPMVPSLIATLKKSSFSQIPLVKSGLTLSHPASKVIDTIVYLDPPYQGTTKYPDGNLNRNDLVSLAMAWHQAGALVVVSEAEPIKELIGWKSICLLGNVNNQSSFKSKKSEWVTVSP